MSNVHGTTLPAPFIGSARPIDVDGWRPPEPEGRDGPSGYPFRTCWYCGSMHPDDLLSFMASAPVTLGEADWKYGWPHKFYVEGIPNPLAGQRVKSGSRSWTDESGERRDETIWGTGPATAFAKFYTEHIADATDLDALAAALNLRLPNIRWERDAEGHVMWRGHRGTGVR